jgi:hypothetical protein
MSDNGGLSAQGRSGPPHTHNAPLSSGRGSAREGGIREPMVVKRPGVAAPGSVCPHPVMIEDFFPTIIEVTGAATRVKSPPGAALTSCARSMWLCKSWWRLEVGPSSSSWRNCCPPGALGPWWNPDSESGLGKSVATAQAKPETCVPAADSMTNPDSESGLNTQYPMNPDSESRFRIGIPEVV